MNAARHPTAITSLEVLCATLLATLLMTAVLGVVSGVVKRQRAVDHRLPRPVWTQQLERLIRNDFNAAAQMTFLPDGFVLHGLLGTDPRTGTANWRPGAIEYRLLPTDVDQLGKALMRSERRAAAQSTAARAEIVCFGVDRLSFTSTTPLADPQITTETNPPIIFTDLNTELLPAQLYVGLWRANQASPLLAVQLLRP